MLCKLTMQLIHRQKQNPIQPSPLTPKSIPKTSPVCLHKRLGRFGYTMATETATNPRPTPASKPKQPKGILKKTAAAPPSPSPSPPRSRSTPSQQQQQQQQQHLRLLQHLAKTQLKPPVPIETFERLCELPSDPSRPASSPSAADAHTFLSAARQFQPGEYLDLIEERTILGRCGYALCGRPRRTLRGTFKLSARLAGGGIARTEELNKWCSDECARRALYIKVQLDNPSHVRGEDGRFEVVLELLGGADEAEGEGSDKGPATRVDAEDQRQLALAMAQLEIDKSKRQKQAAAALAAERGEEGFLGQQGRVEVTIREKATTDEPAIPPSLNDCAHETVEGYRPTFGTGRKPGENPDAGSDSDDDDEFPTIRL